MVKICQNYGWLVGTGMNNCDQLQYYSFWEILELSIVGICRNSYPALMIRSPVDLQANMKTVDLHISLHGWLVCYGEISW